MGLMLPSIELLLEGANQGVAEAKNVLNIVVKAHDEKVRKGEKGNHLLPKSLGDDNHAQRIISDRLKNYQQNQNDISKNTTNLSESEIILAKYSHLCRKNEYVTGEDRSLRLH